MPAQNRIPAPVRDHDTDLPDKYLCSIGAGCKHKGYEYARSQNPTCKALEDAYASIENAKFALAFGSGVAATDSVMKLLNPGDEVIAANDMYGGTYRLFTKVWSASASGSSTWIPPMPTISNKP